MDTIEAVRSETEPAAPPRAERGRRIRLRPLLFRLFVYGVLLVLSAFILLPVGWMLAAALKPDLAPVFTFLARVSRETKAMIAQKVELSVDTRHLYFFDAEIGEVIYGNGEEAAVLSASSPDSSKSLNLQR
jgi:hypothetical protein